MKRFLLGCVVMLLVSLVQAEEGKEIAELRKKAEAGDSVSQFNLGLRYAKGDGVPKERTEAAKWFRKAAEQGHPKAQFRLGGAYSSGDGVEKNSAEALKWMYQGAEQDATCAAMLGFFFRYGLDIPMDKTEAIKWFRKAATQGSVNAQYQLGSMYVAGEGVPKDDAEAVKWLRMAAEQGDASSQYVLGLLYVQGQGVTKDLTQAVRWIRKAAEQGNSGAQNTLGVLYQKGEGVLKNEIEALAWYYLGAFGGDENSIRNRDSEERRLGQQATLMAQQRSAELLKQIEVSKANREASNSEKPDATVVSGPKSSGSGAIISSHGHILTAAHVVGGAKRVEVVTVKGTQSAAVLRIDETNDIAVLKIEGGLYDPFPIAPSRRIRLGQIVATIGFPHIEIQGFSPKVTRGEISSLNGIADDPRSWQISVPIQSGNSGGPLLDENGNLVGVVVSKLGLKAAQATGDITQNVNYAVKSAYALALLEPYLDSGAPEPNQPSAKPSFEDMVATAQKSVVLILVY